MQVVLNAGGYRVAEACIAKCRLLTLFRILCATLQYGDNAGENSYQLTTHSQLVVGDIIRLPKKSLLSCA